MNKQGMFQQPMRRCDASPHLVNTAHRSKKAWPNHSRILAKGLDSKRLSIFSELSEILDGPGY
jgi:hypothetical protein